MRNVHPAPAGHKKKENRHFVAGLPLDFPGAKWSRIFLVAVLTRPAGVDVAPQLFLKSRFPDHSTRRLETCEFILVRTPVQSGAHPRIVIAPQGLLTRGVAPPSSISRKDKTTQ